MVTKHQEELYNKIVEYYNYAERLIEIAENSSHEFADEQFMIIEKIVDNLENCAEKLATKYIEFIQKKSSKEATESIKLILNDIVSQIEQCRNQILILYQK
jgi:hypothetical protein